MEFRKAIPVLAVAKINGTVAFSAVSLIQTNGALGRKHSDCKLCHIDLVV
jgi:hypothetical protein